jgi:CBS domain-containing protein
MFEFDVREINGAQSHGDGDALGFNLVHLDARVTDIPRAPVLTLPPETSIATAIDVMRHRQRDIAIVVRNQRPLGVVCARDAIAQVCSDIEALRATPISALMIPSAHPLCEDDSVGTALRKMCAHQQWHLPIVCARDLFVGALDVADLARWMRDRLTILTVEAAFS